MLSKTLGLKLAKHMHFLSRTQPPAPPPPDTEMGSGHGNPHARRPGRVYKHQRSPRDTCCAAACSRP